MAHTDSLSDNFDFSLINTFSGYVSSLDKTNAAENIMVRGSQNIYKKISGTLSVRPGQKRQGIANNTFSPVSSSFVWNNSFGRTLPIWVTNNTLQVRYNGLWYTLLSGLTKTRYVFDSWYSTQEAQDFLIFVKGDSDMQWWSGGIATIASATAPTAGVVTAYVLDVAGTGYANGDILTLTGGGGTGATFKATALGGVISAVTLITPGSGYSTGTNLATSGGSGTGATISVSTVATLATITKTNPSVSWALSGFLNDVSDAAFKKIMINGVEYTYTGGESTATLFGVSPDPSAIPAGSIAIQSVVTATDTPNSNTVNDFLKVINNQVYIGSYTSRVIYISSSTGFLFYVQPTPRSQGDPALIILDQTAKGIGVRQGQAHVGYGTSSWAIISFNESSLPTATGGSIPVETVIVTNKPVANLQAPLAHEFIANVGDNIIYVAQDQQLRAFGEFNNAFSAAYPSFSQEIQTELEEANLTGGKLSCIGEFSYITAPTTGKVYLYQVRQLVDQGGNVVAERLWHSPFIWNATAIDVIDGTVVAFSNANPQVYEVWNTGQYYDDSPSDEQLPYECILAFSYRSPRRQGLISFDKNYSEGYFSAGTPLNLRINYNYQGALAALVSPVNSLARPGYTFSGTAAPSLGDNSLGDDSLGNGLVISDDPQDQLLKFKVINMFNQQNCFEYQPIYYSNATNAQWELLVTGTNAVLESDQQATFIINKLRKT